MKTNKQSGFSTVAAAVAVIAVIVVAGLVVWRVFDVNNQPRTENTLTTTSSESSPQAPTETTTYLDVKELNVRIKLDNDTKDTSYSLTSDSSDEGVFIIDPAMKTIDTEQCPGTEAPGMIGLLDRSTDAKHWGEKAINVDNETSFKIGDYYYLFREPQAECSQNSDTSEKRADRIQAFLNILKTIEADNS